MSCVFSAPHRHSAHTHSAHTHTSASNSQEDKENLPEMHAGARERIRLGREEESSVCVFCSDLFLCLLYKE